ncbi:MAG: mannosyl-3-phosphoglycerate phosphatase [Thermodesulfobacteriota bacterium]
MMTTPKWVIFSDLDGCLLDERTYSFEPARPALRLIEEKKIPLVLVSSKTRAEMEEYRKRLKNDHPFVSENGGALFIPKGYFSFPFSHERESGRYLVLELGTFYPQIIRALEFIKRETGIQIRGFHDLSEEELARLSGLSQEETRWAKRREYDEPFIVEGGEKEIQIVQKKIKERGLNYVWGGKFHHILGRNDKGKASQVLIDLYQKEFSSISTVGIGDSVNDLPMLQVVDHPIFLKGGEGLSPEISRLKNLILVEGRGPQAWNEAIFNVSGELTI